MKSWPDLESLLTTFSSRLLSLNRPEFDACIADALGQIALYKGAERGYIFFCLPDGLHMQCMHAWWDNGVPLPPEQRQRLPVNTFPWLQQEVGHRRIVLLNSLDDLPAEAGADRAFLERQGIQSLLVIPIAGEDSVKGFVAFDTVRHNLTWKQKDLNLLRVFSGLFFGTYLRLQVEQRLEHANQRLRSVDSIHSALHTSQGQYKSRGVLALEYLYTQIPYQWGTLFELVDGQRFVRAEAELYNGQAGQAGPKLTMPSEYFMLDTLREGQMVVQPRLSLHDDTSALEWVFYNAGYRSLLLMPLHTQGQYLGVLALLNKEPYSFTEQQQQVVREVASQLAVLLLVTAIDRVRKTVPASYLLSQVPNASGQLGAEAEGGNSTFIKRFTAVLERDYKSSNLTLEKMAQHLNMSRSTLVRQLNRYFGSSYSEVVMTFRLSKATELLAYTDKSIEEIALHCGFGSLSYFSRSFKKAFSVSPIRYRLNHLKNLQ